MGFGTNQCVSEVEPMGLDSITLGKVCGERNRKKRRKPEERLTFRGVHMEQDMPTEETEMQEK